VLPHVPQLLWLVERFTHVPLQLVCPVGQQIPWEQTEPFPQDVAQSPQ
jgi:hypothetical protein